MEEEKEETKPSEVLLLPELLAKILSYYSSPSSINNLLKFRGVCSVWKDCVFSLLVKNLSNIPSIDSHTSSPTYTSYHRRLPGMLQDYFKSVSPSCSIPFRIYLTHSIWCSELHTLFKDYSRNIVHLQINDFLFEKALQLTDFPELRKLELVHWDYEGTTTLNLTQDYFQTKACLLTEIFLDVDANFQFGPMNNLNVLKLSGFSCVSGSESLGKLLPNLSQVSFGIRTDMFCNEDAFDSIAAHGAVFKKVFSLELHEQYGQYNTYIKEDTRPAESIVKCFPNLRKIEWTCLWRICKRISSFHLIFTGLQHLTSLSFVALDKGTGDEVFQLLTGMTVDEIPEEEFQWSTALNGKEKALCNLKQLESLYLKHNKSPDNQKLTPKQCRFLLTALFQRMDALQKITMVNIPYDPDCIQEWTQTATGREFQTTDVEIAENNQLEQEFADDRNDDDFESETW